MPAIINDFEKAEKTLHGLLLGIRADNKIEVVELKQIKEWLELHKNLSHVLPFCELYEMIERVLEDGIVDEYEHDEIMQYIENYDSENSPYGDLKEEMRCLHGFIQGVAINENINSTELDALKKWMVYHESVIDKWPFNELYQLINNILADGIVTAKEQEQFLNFTKIFTEKKGQKQKDESVFVNKWMVNNAPTVETVKNVINKNSQIDIKRKTVCITGIMKVKRSLVFEIVIERGGIPQKNVTLNLDYLVIGALSNPCWQYTTYGRKIETAMEYNRHGAKINIVSENDFLVALNS